MNGFDALLIASVKRNVSIFEKYHTRYDRKQAWIAVAQACQRSGYMVSLHGVQVFISLILQLSTVKLDGRAYEIAMKQNELCQTLITNTTPVPGDTVESQSADEPALQRNCITEFQHEELIIEFKGETNNSNAEFISDDSACHIEQSSSSSNGEGQSQTQAKFMSVMNLIESVLQDKPAEPQDPFYKYLESILAGVDDSTRRDIQLKVLNFVSDEIRGSRQT
ncbi:GM16209 [Drosophila sechellia]|uniref:GM16209 n=1 Tax=Drosophila sechellia TaxID=7238 RepID=B4IPX6_DROSE|nr:GM16209 [Drosophila sechellia]